MCGSHRAHDSSHVMCGSHDSSHVMCGSHRAHNSSHVMCGSLAGSGRLGDTGYIYLLT